MDSFSSDTVPKKRSISKMRTEAVERNEETVNENEASAGNNNNHVDIKDGWNIALLFFLYLLQGIPLGLSGAIPLILQKKHISYSAQVKYICI